MRYSDHEQRLLDQQSGAELDRQAQRREAVTSNLHSFQSRVWSWCIECFQRPDSLSREQRAFRFMEEAIELVQAVDTSREDVLRLVDYVYGRPPGSDVQEVGGVMVTLAALSQSCALDMEAWGEEELRRCIANTEKIRAKDLAKPQRSPLPGSAVETECSGPVTGAPYKAAQYFKHVAICDWRGYAVAEIQFGTDGMPDVHAALGCAKKWVDRLNGSRPETEANSPEASVYERFAKALRADLSWAWSWHCNIAVPLMDRLKVPHADANEMAAHLMQHLFGIDIKQAKEWSQTFPVKSTAPTDTPS